MHNRIILSFIFLFITLSCFSQWENRYPKVEGYGHHVYLEGYELPVLNAGPSDPAPSPLNDEVVFSAKGWLWIYDMYSQEAKRITYSKGLDFRPNWSPDGRQIVFVRDNSLDTQIILMDLYNEKETVLVDTDRLDLDPIFSSSGKEVYYSSAKNGSFDLWKIDLITKENTLITSQKSLERLPVPTSDNGKIVYLKKQGFSYDGIMLLDKTTQTSTVLAEENFMSQTSFSLASNDETLVYTWPNGDDYELRLLNINTPESKMLLTKSKDLPLTPKFSTNGDFVYYSEYDDNEVSQMKRISINGGSAEVLNIKKWNWKTPTSKVRIHSKVDGKTEAVRLSILDATGHPVIPNSGVVHSEGQNGIVFFYSSGEIEVTVPHGEITITATHGFSTKKITKKIEVNSTTTTVEMNLSRIWNPKEAGWYAADNHFHLNYGGTNRLDPEDILLDLKAEEIDIAYPLVANLGNRFLEENLMTWKNEGTPILRFGQEVRSHFFGHLNIIGTEELFWPWVWGPSYDIYTFDDRVNAEALEFAREHDALGGYVHPVGVKDPFKPSAYRSIPVGLVADAVLGKVDMLEVGCLWTDEIGTANLWHEFLNLGIPVALSAGSDVMNDLYRTMAIGATRVYVKPKGVLNEKSFLKALKEGKSFVSNGPQLVFTVEDKEVGEVLSSNKKKANWNLDVYSPIAFDKVEIFVNGNLVWSKDADGESINKYKGTIQIPNNGWVTARVSGGKSEWPMMDSYPFAETSPIWFNEIGSTSLKPKTEAAKKLIDILEASFQLVKEKYKGHEMPKIKAHFSKALNALKVIVGNE